MHMRLRLIVLVWNCIKIIGAASHQNWLKENGSFLCVLNAHIGHGDAAIHYLSLAGSILIELIAPNPIQKPDLPLF